MVKRDTRSKRCPEQERIFLTLPKKEKEENRRPEQLKGLSMCCDLQHKYLEKNHLNLM